MPPAWKAWYKSTENKETKLRAAYAKAKVNFDEIVQQNKVDWEELGRTRTAAGLPVGTPLTNVTSGEAVYSRGDEGDYVSFVPNESRLAVTANGDLRRCYLVRWKKGKTGTTWPDSYEPSCSFDTASVHFQNQAARYIERSDA